MPDTPPELCEESKKAVDDLLPNKSKAVYQLSYDRFVKWQKEHNTTSFSQRVLLTYFSHLSNKWKSSTLWSEYSKLAKMIQIKHNLNLGGYRELKTFLKKTSVGYRPKKSNTLTSENIEKFLNEAPDVTNLATKVAVIFGVLGACRKDELIKIETTHLKTYFEAKDTKKKQPILLVRIPNTKTHQEREFSIKGQYYNYYQRYSDLRPQKTPHNRFFINYHRGKCTVQPIGEKKFASMPKNIAQFLKLPDPKSYTGHAFRKTSATLLAESEADIDPLKRQGGWKSTSIAESYVENSLLINRKTSDQITCSIRLNLPSSSEHSTTLTENPVKKEHLNLSSASESSTDKENSNPSIDSTTLKMLGETQNVARNSSPELSPTKYLWVDAEMAVQDSEDWEPRSLSNPMERVFPADVCDEIGTPVRATTLKQNRQAITLDTAELVHMDHNYDSTPSELRMKLLLSRTTIKRLQQQTRIQKQQIAQLKKKICTLNQLISR